MMTHNDFGNGGFDFVNELVSLFSEISLSRFVDTVVRKVVFFFTVAWALVGGRAAIQSDRKLEICPIKF